MITAQGLRQRHGLIDTEQQSKDRREQLERVPDGQFVVLSKLGKTGPDGRWRKLWGPHWTPPEVEGCVSTGIKGRDLDSKGRVLRS